MAARQYHSTEHYLSDEDDDSEDDEDDGGSSQGSAGDPTAFGGRGTGLNSNSFAFTKTEASFGSGRVVDMANTARLYAIIYLPELAARNPLGPLNSRGGSASSSSFAAGGHRQGSSGFRHSHSSPGSSSGGPSGYGQEGDMDTMPRVLILARVLIDLMKKSDRTDHANIPVGEITSAIEALLTQTVSVDDNQATKHRAMFFRGPHLFVLRTILDNCRHDPLEIAILKTLDGQRDFMWQKKLGVLLLTGRSRREQTYLPCFIDLARLYEDEEDDSDKDTADSNQPVVPSEDVFRPPVPPGQEDDTKDADLPSAADLLEAMHTDPHQFTLPPGKRGSVEADRRLGLSEEQLAQFAADRSLIETRRRQNGTHRSTKKGKKKQAPRPAATAAATDSKDSTTTVRQGRPPHRQARSTDFTQRMTLGRRQKGDQGKKKNKSRRNPMAIVQRSVDPTVIQVCGSLTNKKSDTFSSVFHTKTRRLLDVDTDQYSLLNMITTQSLSMPRESRGAPLLASTLFLSQQEVAATNPQAIHLSYPNDFDTTYKARLQRQHRSDGKSSVDGVREATLSLLDDMTSQNSQMGKAVFGRHRNQVSGKRKRDDIEENGKAEKEYDSGDDMDLLDLDFSSQEEPTAGPRASGGGPRLSMDGRGQTDFSHVMDTLRG